MAGDTPRGVPVAGETSDAGSRGAVKSGDHAALAPAAHSTPMIVTAASEMPTAHGRRRGLRSPRFEMNGTSKSRMPNTSGASTMTQDSSAGGINASTAKYQSRYQSGRG